MAKELQTIPDINTSWWKSLGDEIAERIRVHTKEGKDNKGRGFKGYSDSYKKRKTAGRFKRQSSTSGKPDLELTGDMMRNLQVRGATPKGVTVGWSGTNAEKVQWNEDMGRTVTTKQKPVTEKIERYIMSRLSKQLDKNLKAVEDTTTITIGK